MAKFQDLYEFIERATRSRKYPENTAQSLKAALKLYESELKDEERDSVDKFKENFGQITQSVFTKNAKNFSASSLTTYKSRVQKIITDFEKYSDPIKMNSWAPKIIIRGKKRAAQSFVTNNKSNSDNHEGAPIVSENVHKIELALRTDVKILLIVPRDLKKSEAEIINAVVTSLISKADNQDNLKN